MFKKILVATDLGESSEQALAVALTLTREQQAGLRVIHVIPDLTVEWVLEAYTVDLGVLMEEGRIKAERDLTSLIDRLDPRPADLEARVLIGKPASEIVKYAAAEGADLIVLGSHGRGPVARAFLGSVADRVLREAGCPVLVVRSNAHATAIGAAA